MLIFLNFLQLNGMYYNLSINEGFEKEELTNHVNHSVDEENVDLKRQVSVWTFSLYKSRAKIKYFCQVVYLKQQLSEKDRTISLLQQQMAKYCGVEGSCEDDAEKSNVATQTERVCYFFNLFFCIISETVICRMFEKRMSACLK